MSEARVRRAIKHVQQHLADWDRDNYLYYETPTRYTLIDPIIRGLGWDVNNMDECSTEWPMPPGQWFRRVDYVLGDCNGDPVVVIEAKSLRTPIVNRPRGLENQLATYVKGMMTGVAVLTNGVIWHIYELDASRQAFKNKYAAMVDIREGHGTISGSARTLHEWLDKDKWWL